MFFEMIKKSPKTFLKYSLIGFIMNFLMACQTQQVFNVQAMDTHAIDDWREGAPYKHWVVERIASDSKKKRLFVYLEGDGRPYVFNRYIASDPTPRYPLALHLMLKGAKHDALYIARPCYHQLSDGCTAWFWTQGRYSDKVITSMITVLKNFLSKHTYEEVVLIGYSGGGVIATFMALQIPEVTSLVTIAANLDIHAWTHFHGYDALTDSNNAIEVLEALPQKNIIHFVGKKDNNVPFYLNEKSIVSAGHRVHIEASFDHRCCWLKAWPRLLKQYGFVN